MIWSSLKSGVPVADVAGIWEGVTHIERQRAVLGAVRLISDDDDIVALGVSLVGVYVLVELLDQREDVRLVLGQQAAQVFAAEGAARVTVMVNHAATGKGLVYLRVQVFAVGQHEEGEVAAELAVHLAGEHNHRVALASPLGVPEYTKFALPLLALAHRLDGEVDTEELVIAGKDLLELAGGLVEKDEVLHDVHEVLLVADPFKQRLHVHHARLLLSQAFPVVEVLPLCSYRADLRLFPVAEHNDGVVMEEMRDGVLVIGKVLLKCGFEVLVDILALYE